MSSALDLPLPVYIGGGVLLTTVSVFAIRKGLQIRASMKLAKRRATYPADTVMLNQFPRGPYAPNMSPFPLKLETFLRMADIPYKNQFDMGMSSKQKSPWITYNGQDVADSQFCMEYLQTKLHKDMDSHLSDEDRAVARAFQKMVDEHLYWTLVMERWVFNLDHSAIRKALKMPALMVRYVSRIVKAQVHAQGVGRHTRDEVTQLTRGDLRALSRYLGGKPYLMGDRPSTVDCSVFGMLAQIKWQLPDSAAEKMLQDEFVNLSSYCERMKDHFWPDWEDCITAGGTRKATQ